MLAALLLQAAAPPPMPPADWTNLPELPVPAASGPVSSSFVRREVARNRCQVAFDGVVAEIEAPVAVLVDEAGAVQRVVPRAIDCPIVEQYTAGYVSSLARRAGVLKPGWYKFTMTYRWQG
ncbi:hypothetical protein [Sphingomonas lenta]|uniref:hypothetical protein n=1 Tax=Sphingomonas lenta TaxID=1141887 RepID=UPI001140C432|nr:hypothetical protein [Sphingomonas lenta]